MARLHDLVMAGATMVRRPHWHPDEHLCVVVVPFKGFALMNHTWDRDIRGDANPDHWEDWQTDPNDRPHSATAASWETVPPHIRHAAQLIAATYQRDIIMTWVHEAALGERTVESIFSETQEMRGEPLPQDMQDRIVKLVTEMKAEVAAAEVMATYQIPIWTTSRPMQA